MALSLSRKKSTSEADVCWSQSRDGAEDRFCRERAHMQTMPIPLGSSYSQPMRGRHLSSVEVRVELDLLCQLVRGFDLAIRFGEARPSALVAQKLPDMRGIAAASPAFRSMR